MNEKTELLEMISGKNRGLLSSEADRLAILLAIENLEKLNPNPQPLNDASLIEGDWRLLYTTSRALLGLDRIPVFNIGQIYQSIRTRDMRIYNIAEVLGIPFLESIVSVCAIYTPVSEKRVQVKFDRSIVGLQKLINYISPSQFIDLIEHDQKFPPLDFSIGNREQKGWLEITYLDQDLRVGRGNEGSLFVLTKN